MKIAADPKYTEGICGMFYAVNQSLDLVFISLILFSIYLQLLRKRKLIIRGVLLSKYFLTGGSY